MTVQFVIEDHPLQHAWHHLARLRAALDLPDSETRAAAAELSLAAEGRERDRKRAFTRRR